MYLSSRGAGGAVSGPVNWLTPQRLLGGSGAIVCVYVAFLATWGWLSHGFAGGNAGRPGIDFSIFWAASHLALQGHPAQVYEHIAFIDAQRDLFGDFADVHSLGWVYPPAFLLFVSPLGLLPFWTAYLLFVAVCAGCYVFATTSVSNVQQGLGGKRLAALLAAALPGAFVAAIVGQNSLITAALAALAVRWVAQKPVAAGLCIGLLAIKPQVALVFPFVLIASRAWKVFVAAALSAVVTTAAGILVCGIHSMNAFLTNAGVLRDALLDHGGQHFWFASPTTLSTLRLAGVPVVAAYVGQACVTAVAMIAACNVWQRCADPRLRAAAVTLAALLASPYAWHYELAWLGVALVCLAALALEGGWLRGEQPAWLAGWLLPIYEHFNRIAMLPQVGPLVLLALLWAVLRRARSIAKSER
jgi:alpha-1,2-mannosyltransferase